MPPSHPLLTHGGEGGGGAQQSNVRIVAGGGGGGGGTGGVHFEFTGDHHGDSHNVFAMQQFLRSVAGDIGLHVATANGNGGGGATRPRG